MSLGWETLEEEGTPSGRQEMSQMAETEEAEEAGTVS